MWLVVLLVAVGSAVEPALSGAPRLEAAASMVSGEELMSTLRDLAGWRRGAGSSGLEAARRYVVERLRAAGLEVRLEEFQALAGGGRFSAQPARRPRVVYGCNVVGVLEGCWRRNETVVVCAHLDSVGNYGADDDASGVAVVLELAEVFSSIGAGRTIVFILFDCEELGLVGSRKHVERRLDYYAATCVAVVDLDMVGYAPPALNPLSPGDRASMALAELIADLSERYLGYRPPLTWSATGRSDFASFAQAGVPAVLVHERVLNPHYHRDDLPEYIDVRALELAGRVAALAVCWLSWCPRLPEWAAERMCGYGVVEVYAGGAEVLVEGSGAPARRSPAVFYLKPGEYTIRARRSLVLLVEEGVREVRVEAGSHLVVEVRLKLRAPSLSEVFVSIAELSPLVVALSMAFCLLYFQLSLYRASGGRGVGFGVRFFTLVEKAFELGLRGAALRARAPMLVSYAMAAAGSLSASRAGSAGLIPLVVGLMVVASGELQALEQRRREVAVLSAVGGSPSAIAGLYLAEAVPQAMAGGALGGLLAALLLAGLQPVSWLEAGLLAAEGCFLCAAVALAASLYPSAALSRSVTPSLVRRWVPREVGEGEVHRLPVKLDPRLARSLHRFLVEKYSSSIMVQRVELAGGDRPRVRVYRGVVDPYTGVEAPAVIEYVASSSEEGGWWIRVECTRAPDTSPSRVRAEAAELARKDFFEWYCSR